MSAAKHRLFVPDLLDVDDSLPLAKAAAHYLLRVLRLRAGAAVTLFNGDGYNYQATLEQERPPLVRVQSRTAGPPDQPLELAVALLKGDRMDWALQKATELGARKIHLVRCARSEVRLSNERLTKRLSHWRQILLSAAEQSGRCFVPELLPPTDLTSVLEQTRDQQRVCLEPSAEETRIAPTSSALCVFTGPEGGFTLDELDLLRSHCQMLRFGELILRAETAPIAGLTLAAAAQAAAVN